MYQSRLTNFFDFQHIGVFEKNNQQKRTSIFAIILFIFFTLLCCPLSALSEEQKTVRIAYSEFDLLIRFDKKKNKLVGYVPEYFSRIAAYTNWNIEYINTQGFYDCIDKLKSNQVDLTYEVSKTPEREKFMLFAEIPSGNERYYLYAHKNNKGINPDDFSSLQGKTAGVEKGSIQATYLAEWSKKHSIKLNIIEYISEVEKERALLQGEIDLDCTAYFKLNPNYTAIAEIGNSNYYMVFNKNRADLLEEFNNAQRQILAWDPLFFDKLNGKYFSNTTVRKTLSTDEKNWLASHNRLRIGLLEDFAPFSYTDKKDQSITGYIPALIKRIFRRLNIKNIYTEFILYPDMKKLKEALKQGDIDIIFPFYPDIVEAKKDNLTISKLKESSFLGMLCKKSAKENPRYDKIAVLKDRTGSHFIRHNYPFAEIIPFNTIQECIKAVERDEATCAIAHFSAFDSRDWDETTLTFQKMSIPHISCFAGIKQQALPLSLLDKGYVLFTDEERETLVDRYTRIPKQSVYSFLREHFLYIILLSFFIIILITLFLIVFFFSNKKLKKANETVNKQKALLTKAVQSAETAAKAKTDFLFNISHDIRTPLNVIIGFNNHALKNLEYPDIARESLIKVQKSSELLLLMVNNILEFVHVNKEQDFISEKPADILQVFSYIEPMLSEDAKAKQIDLLFNFEEVRNTFVYIDFTQVIKILLNIIKNALTFTTDGGKVHVQLTQEHDKEENIGIYRFTVEDTGIGMSEEFQKHMFEPFMREKNSTATGIYGAGLGLPLCKKLVDLMHGTITCTSQKGKGSLFTITLPLKIIERNTEQNPEKETRKEATSLSFKEKKVLIVEDNELNMEILADILEEKGMTIDSAEHGEIAVKKLRRYGPTYYDFILMDIQMPVMNGYEATKAIRSMYPEYHIPIIAVSANNFEEDIKQSFASGMDAHIAKPIDPTLLFDTMAQYLIGRK